MTLKVILSIQLRNADRRQRRVFGNEMEKRQWARFSEKGTAYCTEIHGLGCDADALPTIEADVTECAEKACVYDWDGMCLVSDSAGSVPLRRSSRPAFDADVLSDVHL